MKSRDVNILAVVESIDVNDSSGSKANVALIKNLNKLGYNILVCHYSRKDIQIENIKCIALKENRSSLLFYLSRAERYLRTLLNIRLNKYIDQIFGFSFTLLNDKNSIVNGLRKIEGFSPDLIFTLSKGGSFRPHHALLKLPELHDRWVAYFHDPYPMHLYPPPYAWVEKGYYKKWNFVKEVSESARFFAFPSLLLRDWMGSYFQRFLSKSYIIPHQIVDIESSEYLKLPDYYKPENFNLLHAGTLLKQRDPRNLIQAFLNFLEVTPEAKENARLIFVGPSIYSPHLNQYSKNIIYDDYLDFKVVFEMQSKASANIILEANAQISPFLPGKFPHCIQANKPVMLIGPKLSESRRLLGENYTYWAENKDVPELTKLINRIYSNWSKNEGMFLNREDLRKYLSETYLKETIQKILEE